MLILFQSIERFRETFPLLPLALIGIGFLALLWLLRHNRKKKKTKPASIKRLEDRHSAAIKEIGSIKMNQWMDKHIGALIIPRRKSPPNAQTQRSLRQVTAFQEQSAERAKARTDKTLGKGVS